VEKGKDQEPARGERKSKPLFEERKKREKLGGRRANTGGPRKVSSGRGEGGDLGEKELWLFSFSAGGKGRKEDIQEKGEVSRRGIY